MNIRINWKVRLRNGNWLASMAALIIAFVYGVLDLAGIAPGLTQEKTVQALQAVLTFLGLIGVINDPTTAGLGDSERALGYERPWEDGRS